MVKLLNDRTVQIAILVIIAAMAPILLTSMGKAGTEGMDMEMVAEYDCPDGFVFQPGPAREVNSLNDSDSSQVTVDFSGSPTSGVIPLAVTFTNLSTGEFDACLWDFGYGHTASDSPGIIHEFTTTGNFTVSLTVSNDWGSDTVVKPNYIVSC